MRPIIQVQELGKQYRIGARAEPYTTFREALYRFSRRPHRIFRADPRAADLFWALRDVSFEVDPGEVVGVIGRNGAGKSTLLKILARVTEPTKGRIELRGSVNSLLEVGTGFHPELTGRENIFVNGAILGLKKSQIQRLFDEIVAFAEIEKFLDAAVKHYSSGMYMRLAFSVAAHLSPDILIIDEVLAVGDQQFQKKCLGKVHDVAKEGRTVLFVSHNMAAVEHLCDRGIVLEKGKVVFEGGQTRAISHYLESVNKNFDANLKDHPDRTGSGEVRVTRIEIKDLNGNTLHSVRSGQDIDIFFHFATSQNYQKSNVGICLMARTYLDIPVFLQHNRMTGDNWDSVPQNGAFVCRLRRLPLPPATYRLGFSVMRGEDYFDRIDDASELIVTEGDFYGTGIIPPITHGHCLVEADWRVLDSKETL